MTYTECHNIVDIDPISATYTPVYTPKVSQVDSECYLGIGLYRVRIE
jgi:hypothetical protein